MKREGYLSWDEYFMAMAVLAGRRSKDPSTQVGACIASPENKVVGVGYNGLPRGCSDDDFPWEREGELLDTKYPYVVHAERNAILNAISRNLEGCRLYVALFPCHECAKEIIQVGITEIIYLSDKYHDTDDCTAARKMLTAAGIVTRQYDARADIVAVIAGL